MAIFNSYVSYQRVSLYSVYSLSIAPTNPPAKVGHSTTQSPPLIAAWWFQLVDVGRSPRVWCLKSTRFWFPLPTSRISGLAVDLSFSCHPRHRSCGRPVVSSQKMIKMVTWSGIPWKKSSGVIGYTQEWWQTTHCFPDFYYDQELGWCGLCQFHFLVATSPSLMDKNP